MVRRRARQIGRALLIVLALAIVARAELRGAQQGERITRIEHIATVELCSTTVSCRHLLDDLIASIGPKERRAIQEHFVPRKPSLPAAAKRLAPKVAHRHRAAKRRVATRRAHRRARRPTLLQPAPAIAIPAAPPPPPPPVPQSTAAAEPSSPAHEPPGQEKKPEHQLCVHLPVAERLLCR